MINTIVDAVNNVLWGDGRVLIYLLIVTGIWFSVRLRFVQLRHFSHMFSVMRGSAESNESGISSFQALCTSLSARVGTGNLAGVAVAISLGGSGAVFWMWVIAFLGMATGFAESVLGQLYKVRDDNNEFRGGPAYYIKQGLGQHWLAILFSLSLFLGYGLIFSSVQANTITDAINHAYAVPRGYTGIIIVVFAAMVIVGGIRSIASFAQWIVPIMAGAYLLVVMLITVINIEAVPAVLADIINSAFGLGEAGAGAMGAAIKQGIQRGLYSNEAGSGSVPHAAACAAPQPNHPVSQGYVQMLGVFIDTIVLCTCTATVILLAGVSDSSEMEGIRLTQNAMTSHLGILGTHFLTIAVTLFAFTSVVANYVYGENNLHIFKLDHKLGRGLYMGTYLAMVMWGSLAPLKIAWALADMALGIMTLINIIAIVWLTPTIVAISQDYFKKHDGGKEIEYKSGDCIIQGESKKNVWD